MSAIGRGDIVEFIGRPAGYINPGGTPMYTVGQVYRVTEVGRRCVDGAGQVWEALKTSETPPGMAVPIAAFKPGGYRPTEDIRRLMEMPAHEGVLTATKP